MTPISSTLTRVAAAAEALVTICCLLAQLPSRAAEPTTIYATGFEASEGFNEGPLVGQEGWRAFGSGGNGVVTNFFEGFGQQAFIGFTPLSGTNDFLSLFHPINLAPIPADQPLVRFSVMFQIVDSTSTNGPWDDFRWSVYNTNVQRLFTLDFDNSSFLISYSLDDGAGFVSTDTKFDNRGFSELAVEMNFARNLWSATLNDQVIVHSKPITTTGSALNLGDIDAVWVPQDPARPGDNYMLFDEYSVTLESPESIPPRLEPVGLTSGRLFRARLYGEPGLSYRIEASTDLRQWESLLTFTAPSTGMLDFKDPTAANFPYRFYRIREGR